MVKAYYTDNRLDIINGIHSDQHIVKTGASLGLINQTIINTNSNIV
jgi:hypothetical protein